MVGLEENVQVLRKRQQQDERCYLSHVSIPGSRENVAGVILLLAFAAFEQAWEA